MDIKRVIAHSLAGGLLVSCFLAYRALDYRVRSMDDRFGDYRLKHMASSTTLMPPQPTSTPPTSNPVVDDPVLAKRKACLTGGPFWGEGRFAVLGDCGLAFFKIPEGVKSQWFDNLKQMPSANPRAMITYFCDPKNVTPDKGCSDPIFPEAVKVVEAEVLQVITDRYAMSKPKTLLLVSTERYTGGRNTVHQPPANPFYAVYDMSGNEIYRLPKIEISSGTHVYAISINQEKPSALFAIGGLIDVCNADEDFEMPAKVQKVFIWNPPNKLTPMDASKKTLELEAIMKEFAVEDSLFEFYVWPKERHGC